MTKLTLLADNTADLPLLSEHGFSVLISHNEKRYLFDAGQNEALFHNAEELNIALSSLDGIILSHGHYDHGGNLAAVLRTSPGASFTAHPDIFTRRWSLHPGKPSKYIGLTPENARSLKDSRTGHNHFTKHSGQIAPGMFFSGEIPRITDFEDTGGPFFLDEKGERPDLLADDISLWFEGEQGVTVLCGCCHSGLINTLEHIDSLTGGIPIHTVIGGLHLVHAENERMEKTVDELNRRKLVRLVTCHCTGKDAEDFLYSRFNGELIRGKCGLTLSVV